MTTTTQPRQIVSADRLVEDAVELARRCLDLADRQEREIARLEALCAREVGAVAEASR